MNRNFNNKTYELSDHLGNVKVVVSDKRKGQDLDNNDIVDFYFADVVSATDFYSFGMEMPGRSFGSDEYKYSFNGMEKDKNWTNTNSHLDFGARIYDSRLGRWFATDNKEKLYSSLSPYNFVANSPLKFIDPNGEHIEIVETKTSEGKTLLTINVTGKVYFNDGLNRSEKAKQRIVANINSRIHNNYTFSDGDIEVVTNINLTLANSTSEIVEDDHMIYIVNVSQVKPKKFDNHNVEAYVNEIGGKSMYASVSDNIEHEFGHWLGLRHPKDYRGQANQFAIENQFDKNNDNGFDGTTGEGLFNRFKTTNIMHHPEDTKTSNQKTSVTGFQINLISKQRYNNGKLNWGSNKYDPKLNTKNKYEILNLRKDTKVLNNGS